MTYRLASLLLLAALSGACAHAPKTAPESLRDVPAETLFAQGLARADAGDHVPAEQYLTAARARGYPEATVVRALVKVCVASHRFDSALGHALPYLEQHPEDWRLRQVVATIYMASGDAPSARTALENVIDDAPHVPESHFLLGVVLKDDYGDEDSARVEFERYLALAPQGVHAAEARGLVARSSRPVRARSEVTQ